MIIVDHQCSIGDKQFRVIVCSIWELNFEFVSLGVGFKTAIMVHISYFSDWLLTRIENFVVNELARSIASAAHASAGYLFTIKIPMAPG